jgi:hypothetical protein
MSHPEQTKFVQLVRDLNAGAISSSRILEVGSFDVYGTFRSMFATAGAYIGIDLSAGPGVDLVISAHDMVGNQGLGGEFDFVISCEALEHDPDWRLTITNSLAVLATPGMLVVTCASTGRPEHGTTRTNPEESPGTQSLGWDHYANVGIEEFIAHVRSVDSTVRVHAWRNPRIFDLYAVVIKGDPGNHTLTVPTDYQVAQIISSTPLVYQMARWPIRVVSAVGGVSRGETFGRHWWTALSKRMAGSVRGSQVD